MTISELKPSWLALARMVALSICITGGISSTAVAESKPAISTDIDITQPGGADYMARCAMCHEHPQGRVPPRVTMLPLTPEYVERILTSGSMQAQASGLTKEQIRALSTFLTLKPFGSTPEPDAMANLCTQSSPLRAAATDWSNWGRDYDNTRFQKKAGLKAADVSRLKVKWVFAMPGRAVYGQPTVLGDRLFIGTVVGRVFSLNARTGCTHWSYDAEASVKTAVVIGKSSAVPGGYIAYFADERGVVYAVDATTGKEVWKLRVDDHPLARIIGAPTVQDGRVYVPVASQEELASRQLTYACCTFRGSIVALDGATGKIVWKSYNLDEVPTPKTTASGRQMFGPAGVGIWNAIVVDAGKGMIYSGTGNSYAEVPTTTANAIIGLDLATGARRWVNQVQTHDNWTTGCWRPKNENCPEADGPDNDFASAPLLRKLSGGMRILVAAQKTGDMYGVDPDHDGKILWRMAPAVNDVPASQADNSDSGILYGMAADRDNVYAARTGKGGVTAFKLATGEQVWRTPSPNVGCAWGTSACTNAQASAPIVIPGAVFAGSHDGHVRAYATRDGRILWDFDTAAQAYKAVNGTSATGGTISGSSQIIANGMLYVASGYIHPHAGNALIAFSVDGK